MLTIHPTNDVTYTTGGLVVGYDGLLWPTTQAELPSDIPQIGGTLALELGLTGTVEQPEVAVPTIGGTLGLELGLSGSVEQPTATVPEAGGTLALELGLSGTLDQPTATVPQTSGTLGLEIGLSGSVSHPLHLTADVVPGAYRPTTVAATHQPPQIPGRV